MDVAKLRAALLLRRGWRATLLLGLLGGLAGGVAMAALSLARHASTAFDRFLDESDPSDLVINFCPPELVEVDDETLVQCFVYDAVAEVDVARQRPEVETAGRASYVGVALSPVDDPGRTWLASGIVQLDEEPSAVDGEPIVVAGRRPDPASPDEVAINERLAEVSGAGIGDQLDLTFWGEGELGTTDPADGTFHGPSVRAIVVGVERNVRDLIARVGTANSAIDELRLSIGPGLVATIGGVTGFGGLAVSASDDDVEGLRAAIDETFAGRLYNVTPVLEADDTEPVAEAIRYEAGGTFVFAVITALAGVTFAGQAVSRQSRREWADGRTLRWLGMSDRDATVAAALRGAVTGALAAVVAIVSGLALTALGPFGIAGRVEREDGLVIDAPVLLLGSSLVLATVIVATWWPVARQFRWPSPASSRRRGYLGVLPAHLSPPAAAGLSLSLSRRGAGGLPTGAAIAGVALATATAIAAVGLTASLDDLTNNSARFGALWDLSVSTTIDEDGELAAVLEVVRTDPDVVAAAGMLGTDARIGDETAWLQAFEPIDGVGDSIGPVITEGRAPTAGDEIALGAATMEDQGVTIGSTIDVQPATSRPDDVLRMTVVGRTVVNDNSENNPGRGGVVTTAWTERFAPEISPDTVVVRLAPGADEERIVAELAAVSTGGVTGPVRQGAIRNVERIGWLPFLLAAMMALLALASLAHALVLSVHRQRGQLAVLKSLGFRRGQVRTAVAWQATALVLIAVVVGVPLGLVAGRWGWRAVTDQLGVTSPPVTPIWWVLVIVGGTVVIANVIAAHPARTAARLPTAQALRAE